MRGSSTNTIGLACVGIVASLVVVAVIKKRSRDEESTERNEKNGEDSNEKPPIGEIHLEKSISKSFNDKQRVLSDGLITIAHGSVTGTCKRMAEQLGNELSKAGCTYQLGTTEDWDWWDELLNDESDQSRLTQKTPLLVLFLPTYTNGTWSTPANTLESALMDLQNDWRIAKFPLKKKLRVAVFGMGSSAYDETDGKSNMGKPAREAVRAFQKLGAKCITRLAVGDDSRGSNAEETFSTWKDVLMNQITPQKQEKDHSCACADSGEAPTSGGCCSSGNEDKNSGCTSHVEQEDGDEFYSDEDEENEEPGVGDIEDMAESACSPGVDGQEPREMVTPSQAKALKKEGYKLIGTHSAVKLCRWTKHQLRGRGGCYKHTFYGITSYQCMEATPSLACANKCVFCWRHHKNPVGKEWRWKTDDPDFIVSRAVETHVKMIKEAKGIPGVRMDRWQEALTVRHCALSLVGEPIMYPRIGELLKGLHDRQISTFLVTNGQHPQAIETLRPITQLYVSVDAPTKTSLIEIDRPLFNDAWERLRESLKSLKLKGQRTVARLTVVKGWNSDEVEGYAQLIALGHVSLVEMKGVTFCGKSDASNLNMSNSPWHHEVVELAKTLKRELDKIRAQGGDDPIPEYDLACEHKHSCSVLLARVDQFTRTDPSSGSRIWQTWIDYDKFQRLTSEYDKDPSFTFGVEDYVADTPSWALFGAQEEGFDPTDQRHRRKKKYPKYTRFDDSGVPTHDDNDEPLSAEERNRLELEMQERKRQIGNESVVTELKGGEKTISDASLMFRGLVVTK